MSEQKENNADAVLYKERSYLSCMNQGLKLPTRHIISLSKYLLPSVLCSVVAVAIALFISYSYPLPFSPIADNKLDTTTVIATSLSVLTLFVLCEGCFLSQLFHLISKYAEYGGWQTFTLKQSVDGLRRFFPKVILYLIIGVVFTALVNVPLLVWLGIDSIWTYVVFFLCLVFVLIPYTMVGWDYALSHNSSFLQSLLRIKDGYRYFGSYSAVWLVCGLITLAMTCVVWLPTVILLYAHRASMLSESMGDISDLPNILLPLLFVFVMLSTIISKLLSCLLFFPLSYLYGSIATRKKEEMKLEEEEKRLASV